MKRPVEQSMFPDIKPDRPVGAIPASVQTGDNADLMVTCERLGYFPGSVLDVTYGEGAWWRRYRPEQFTAHDLYKLDGVDFTALPEADRSIDTVCFDPPYVISGGKSTSTAGDFLDDYGIGDRGRDDFYDLILGGLRECARVARRFVLVKCMEFAQGGEFHDVPFTVREWAHTFDLHTHDVIVHLTGHGPGGHNIFTPVRARRHHSYLLVFAVPR